MDALVRHRAVSHPDEQGRPGGSVRSGPLMGCSNVESASPDGRCDPLQIRKAESRICPVPRGAGVR